MNGPYSGSNFPSFAVAGFNGLAIDGRPLKDRVSRAVVSKLLRARKEISRHI